MWGALSEPLEAWHFDFRSPPDSSDHKTLDVTFTKDGRFNAVVFWYTLRLFEGIEISSGPHVQPNGEPPSQYGFWNVNPSAAWTVITSRC